MPPDPQKPPPTLQRPGLPPRRRATVRHVEQITPRVVRVTLSGDELEAFEVEGPANHIKLIFPAPGQTEVIPPSPDTPEELRPKLRTYTPLRFDRSRRQLEVEFVLHGSGVGSSWAREAQPGNVVVVAGPRGSYQVPQGLAWQYIFADETAIPAATTILDALTPRTHGAAWFEVQDALEERDIALPHRDIALSWLHRGIDIRQAGVPLETAIRELELPPGPGQIWLACEATAMRRIRRYLVSERGVAPSMVVTRGYWKLGEVDHTDHDYGTDGDEEDDHR